MRPMIGFVMMQKSYVPFLSPSPCLRFVLRKALQQELAYASYLNVESAILPVPRNRDHVASYARIVNSCLNNTPFINLSIRLPVYNPSVLHTNAPLVGDPASPSPSTPPKRHIPGNSLSATLESELNGTWEMWDLIRSICDYNTRLTLSGFLPTFF